MSRGDAPAPEDVQVATVTAVGYTALLLAVLLPGALLLLGQTEGHEKLIYAGATVATVGTAIVTSRPGFVSSSAGRMAPHLLGVVCVALLGARTAVDTVPGLADRGTAVLLVLLGTGALLVPLALARGWVPARPAPEVSLLLIFVGATAFIPSFVNGRLAVTSAALGAITVAIAERLRFRRPRLRRAWEVVFLLVVVLLAVDVQFHPVWYLIHHQGYFLGPIVQMQHGDPMLVDTFSVYGVLMFDALSALFDVVPAGYGTLSLTVGLLTAAALCWLYGMLVAIGCRRALAMGAVFCTMLLVVFATRENYVEYPSSGVLRFAPPYAALGLWLWSHRASHRSRTRVALLLAGIAVASAWSAEGATWTVAGVGVAWAVAELIEPRDSRPRMLRIVGPISATLGAALFGIAATYGLTWAISGSKPHITLYVDLVSAFAVNNVGSALVAPWSVGLLTAGLLGLSLAATIAAVRSPGTSVLPLAASAGIGIIGAGSVSYFVSNSVPSNAIPPTVAVIALAAVWAEQGLRARSPSLRRVTLGIAVSIATMLVLSTVSSVVDKFPRTALAATLPGGGAGGTSLRDALERIGSNPPIVPRVDGVVAALDRAAGRSEPVVVLLNSALAVEVMLRGDRGNALPFGFAKQESHSPLLRRRLLQLARRVPAGTILIAPLNVRRSAPGVAGLDPFSIAILRRLRTRGLVLLGTYDGGDPITTVGIWRMTDGSSHGDARHG